VSSESEPRNARTADRIGGDGGGERFQWRGVLQAVRASSYSVIVGNFLCRIVRRMSCW